MLQYLLTCLQRRTAKPRYDSKQTDGDDRQGSADDCSILQRRCWCDVQRHGVDIPQLGRKAGWRSTSPNGSVARITVAHFTVADFTDPTKNWLPNLPLPNFPVAQFSLAHFTVPQFTVYQPVAPIRLVFIK